MNLLNFIRWMSISLIGLAATVFVTRRNIAAQYPNGCYHEAVEIGLQDEFQRTMQHILEDFSSENQDIALQATILKPGEGMWSAAAGQANRSLHCQANVGCYFYIGSVSKTYTAALVLKLVDEGLLGLDDAAADWLPLLDASHGITVRQLLQQTSGLPSYTDQSQFAVQWLLLPEKQWQPEQLFTLVSEKPLLFEPGTRFRYSNTNYLLLGMLVEAVTGEDYNTLLQRFLLHPHGLHDTFYLGGEYTATPVVHGYDRDLARLGDATAFRRGHETAAYAAGGLVTRSSDLATFTHLLFNGEILSPHSLQQMVQFINVTDANVPQTGGYGLGVRRMLVGGQELWGHTGTITGFSAVTVYSPQHHYVISLSGNRSTYNVMALLERLQNALLLSS